MPQPETVGDRTKRLRKARKLSQAQLAKAVGLSDSYISFIESGSRTPSPAVLHRLAAFFDVNPTFLRYGDRVQQALNAVLERRDAQHRHAVQTIDVVFAKCGSQDVVTCESHTLLVDGKEITTLTIIKERVGDLDAVLVSTAVPAQRDTLPVESLAPAAGSAGAPRHAV
ncbi:helix-turn-helix transcriptional regulator [Nonomuraea sp. NPDC049695]|uniref:helix-turn-helix domain-containing protein n=1 Tax=Nonomuraea sp. NPDC049695 TaxID=3154734 RepID=UPI00342C64FD